MRAGISGAASILERQIAGGMDAVVQHVIRRALADAGVALAEVDMVVTVASDTLDGMMVPVRSDMAGALGKAYLNVPSSTGHALMAATVAIEAGEANTVLLVGWGAASKLAECDSRTNQLDPFWLRPLGVSISSLQAMQRHSLIDRGLLTDEAIEAHAFRMGGIIWGTSQPGSFCDGAAAIVLRRVEEDSAGYVVGRTGTASRSQIPLDGNIDPKLWVDEAMARIGAERAEFSFVEVCGQTPPAELRALAAFPGIEPETANAHGGCSKAWFGPAAPLRNLAALHAASKQVGTQRGVLIDLAGPFGQHVTAIELRAGGSHEA